MGSLESRSPFKKDHHLQGSSSLRNTTTSSSSSSSNVSGFWGQRNRSRFARLVFFRKINYLQLICAVAVFFFFVFLIQMSLPGSVMDDVRKNDKTHHLFRKNGEGNYTDLSFFKELDFGEDVNFEPSKILAKFQKDAKEVFADLWVDPHQILMATVATALREIGYEIEVFSLEDGPVHAIWREVGLPLSVITADENMKFSVDWLNYNGILVNSLKAVGFLSSLMQEPFRHVPVIWTIHEQTLALRLREYVSSGQTDLVDNWRKVFSRATVIVFQNYILPMAYSACDPGNYFVIRGSPAEAWKAENFLASNGDNPHLEIGYAQDDFVVAVVGSQILYRGLWLDHAFVLQALHPVLRDFSSSSSRLKIIILAGHSTSNYSSAVETIARTLKYPNETIKHVAVDDADTVLSTADLVIYGSFLEEHTFPDTLLKAMCFGKPIIAPDLPMIRKYVTDRVNGYIFPKEDIGVLTQIMSQLVSNGRLSLSAQDAASSGKHAAKNLMVSESVEGYALLLENILALPSEVSISQAAKQIPVELKVEWQWHHFEAIKDAHSPNETRRIYKFLDKVEKQFNHTFKEHPVALYTINDTFLYGIWEEQKYVDMVNMRKRREDEESTRGRRPGADDIDAPSRLPLLSNAYYRDVLEEYGAFFAIANRIDRIHKNAWIGFQSWRATARMIIVGAIEARRHGDALYFWAGLHMDMRNHLEQDFWSFCDAINAGNCRFAFSEALTKMYGLKHNVSSLPPMPLHEGTWSVMHCWALPTKSFLEFVMFSRMFVDALDAQFSDEHQKTGRCCLNLSKDKHCYSRLLELLINVWTYHSARRMVYVDPETGYMQEQHMLNGRRGRMWVKWFQFSTLKSMDEDLAEELDSEHPKRRWLWPSTGEVFWQGIYEKERELRNKVKERKRQQSKDKIQRMRRRARQKALGKYVKPAEDSNSTTVKLLR
ncbi:UNVERIFIED_CONTAM: hypothetical protein Scaly_0244400 [Sesamum calycinum]|uniref:Glycosyl transferase family 1 domain-containing protein n=1 Tax=Sesamum calycinum TaxID=2727403 RepID=A0AAW2SZY2_9LAMI